MSGASVTGADVQERAPRVPNEEVKEYLGTVPTDASGILQESRSGEWYGVPPAAQT